MIFLSKKIQSYAELAKRCANHSTFRQKHGAVLVKGGSVINTAYNSQGFSRFGERFLRRNSEYYASSHAEIKVVLGIDKSITNNGLIIVVRVNKHNQFRFSRPCSMCVDALRYVGIKKVIYSLNNGFDVMVF